MNRNDDELTLAEYIKKKTSVFLASHDQNVVPLNVYHTVINEVECAVIESVMEYVGNNQVQAAKILGINRNTLRKKLNL